MLERLAALVVEESRWLTASMTLALAAVAVLLMRHRGADVPARRRILASMNLFFGVTIGTMALGHLVAVSTKLVLGTLAGPVPRLYLIGIALALPSWWLVVHIRALLVSGDGSARKTLVLNAWLALTLVALGVSNLPLAAPALLNVGYQLHSRRWLGHAIVGLAVLVQAGLFVGSLVFLASGRSFEELRGLR